PGARQHVHLSPDRATAKTVGGRRGKPVILQIDAAGLAASGHLFYQSANGVWLTDHVPPTALTLLEEAP
ncbi:MAG: RNA 2'-phosphotransferase, partial [Pseudomonadota bacterium]